MIEREAIAKQFYIDDHAVIYGLLARAADQLYGERGMKASARATVLYASERAGEWQSGRPGTGTL